MKASSESGLCPTRIVLLASRAAVAHRSFLPRAMRIVPNQIEDAGRGRRAGVFARIGRGDRDGRGPLTEAIARGGRAASAGSLGGAVLSRGGNLHVVLVEGVGQLLSTWAAFRSFANGMSLGSVHAGVGQGA